jgi:hypothetical protein
MDVSGYIYRLQRAKFAAKRERAGISSEGIARARESGQGGLAWGSATALIAPAALRPHNLQTEIELNGVKLIAEAM